MIFSEEQQRRLANSARRPKICKPGLRTAQSVTVPSSALSPDSSRSSTNASNGPVRRPTQAVYSGTGGTPFRRSAHGGFPSGAYSDHLSRARLEKMGVFDGSIMENRCSGSTPNAA